MLQNTQHGLDNIVSNYWATIAPRPRRDCDGQTDNEAERVFEKETPFEYDYKEKHKIPGDMYIAD